MGDILTIQWSVSENAVANEVGGETVILHLKNGHYYGLDAIGTQLWEGLKSGLRPSDICTRLLEDFEVERQTLEQDLRVFLEELRDHELVHQA